jgi:hypothetical protein
MNIDAFTINDDVSVYNVLYNRYLLEWQRTTSLENKVTGIIGFLGAIIIFILNLSLDHLKGIGSNFKMLLCFDISLFLLISAIIFSMFALFYGHKKFMLLNTEHVLNEYVMKNRPLLSATFPIICEQIRYNSIINR